MSTWRRKAMEEFPDLKNQFRSRTSIYGVFFALLQRCKQGHRENNEAELKLIYAYAAWCSAQRAKSLWNAAGVPFYEHLVDQPEMIRALPRWILAETFHNVEGLFEWRLSAEEFALLKERFHKAKREGRTSLEW